MTPGFDLRAPVPLLRCSLPHGLWRRLARALASPRARRELQRVLSIVVLASMLLQPLAPAMTWAATTTAPGRPGLADKPGLSAAAPAPEGGPGMGGTGERRDKGPDRAADQARASAVSTIPGVRVYDQVDVNCSSPQYAQVPTTFSAGESAIYTAYAEKALYICSQGAYVRISVHVEAQGYLGTQAGGSLSCVSGPCGEFTTSNLVVTETLLPGFYCRRYEGSLTETRYLPPGLYKLYALAESNGVFVNCYGAYYNLQMTISAPPAGSLGPEDKCLTIPVEGTQPYTAGSINTRTGNYNHQQTGFAIPTRGRPLELASSYNSLDTDEGPLGRGWTLNYWTRLISDTNTVTLVAPNGTRLPFYRGANGSFTPGSGVRATLVQEPDGSYTLTLGDQVTYTFDADGRLTALADPAGNTTTLSYDGDDLDTVTAPDGRTLTFTYDQGRIISVRDPLSRTMVLTYTNNLLTAVQDVTGQVWEYGYDGQGRITSLSDPLDATVENEYDAMGRVIVQRDALGHETQIAYFDDRTVVTDTLGAPTTYHYDELNLLTSITDPLGHTTAYEHDDNYNVVAVTDPLGHRTEYEWSDCGCGIETVRDPLGNETHTQFDSHNNPIAVTDALTHTTYLAYDGHDKPIAITNTLGYTATFSYDGLGQLTLSRDPYGRATRYGYDQWGNVTVITDTLGHATHLSYDLAGRLLELEDARGHATQFQLDAAGRPLTVTNALNGETLYRYDAAGRLVELTDANGRHTLLEYDAAGRVITTTNALGGLAVRAYDAAGRLTRLTAPNGAATDYAYDAAGRVITVTNALDAHTVFGYEAAGRAIRVTDPLGEDTLIEYDALGRTVAITDTLGHATRFGYDGVGNLRSVLDPTGVLTQYTYDSLYQLQRLDSPLGQVAGYTYDRLGNLTSVTDGNGHTTTYTYDPLSRLETVLDPLQGLTQYGYDAAGNLTAATDALSHTKTYTYDALDRLLTASDPLQHTTAYGYDAVGNTTVITDAAQLVTHLTYDALDRPVQAAYADQTVSYAYDTVGNRVAMTDTAGVTLYTYDSLSRPLTITAPFAGPVGYRYDARDQRTQTLYPDGSTAGYDYDAAGRLRHVAVGATQAITYTYDAAGRPLTADLANGVHTAYGYDSAGRLVSLAHSKAGGWLTALQYGLDRVGNRVAVTETTTTLGTYPLPLLGRDGGGAEAAASALPVGNTIAYSYDAYDRLTAAAYGNGDRYEYAYDAAGNRTTYTVTQAGLPAQVTHYTYDAADRLASIGGRTVSHDARGNLIGDGIWTYTYDAAGRMTAAASITATLAYTYSGDGLLLAESQAGRETTFTWDQALELPQVLQTSDGLRALYGLERIGVYQDGAWAYPLSDALGSVRQWTDAQGAVLGLQGYGPYGEAVTPIGPALAAFGYTGEWQDASGLVYLRARWYNPAWGRFTQVDPFPGVLDMPATQQPYAYGLNNPILNTDPSGRIVGAMLFGLGLGAAVGAYAYAKNNPGCTAWEYLHNPAFWWSVVVNAEAGAVAGAVGWVVPQLFPTLGLWGTMAVGAFSGALEAAAGQVVANYLTPGAQWNEGLPMAMTWGGAVGAFAAVVGYGSRAPQEAFANGPGSQSIELDFGTYPKNPKVWIPEGPFRLLEGAEYEAARMAADAANKAMHAADPSLDGLYIHEVHPVKWGGSPTDRANKVALDWAEHLEFTRWWAEMQRLVEQGVIR